MSKSSVEFNYFVFPSAYFGVFPNLQPVHVITHFFKILNSKILCHCCFACSSNCPGKKILRTKNKSGHWTAGIEPASLTWKALPSICRALQGMT
jgi:hypothetical protein